MNDRNQPIGLAIGISPLPAWRLTMDVARNNCLGIGQKVDDHGLCPFEQILRQQVSRVCKSFQMLKKRVCGVRKADEGVFPCRLNGSG